MLLEKLDNLLEQSENKMIVVRRYLHMHPEVSYQEKETSQFIAKFYENKEVTVQENVGGYGIKVVIDSGKPGKTIAIRADFDALPILEQTGVEYASKNPGVSHACGHDAHTSYLLHLADALIAIKEDLVGKVVIIHQPAEEVPPGGAIAMIKDGVLDGVDHVFGIHVMSNLDTGVIHYHAGNTMQARAKFTIKIQGKGGHGAIPQEANDAIVAASHLVVALQTIVSRRINPFDSAVITIGDFRGEGQFNIIKDSVTLVGDVRSMSESVKELVETQMRQIVEGIGQTFGCGVELDYVNDYPVLLNDRQMTNLVVNALTEYPIKEVEDVIDGGPWSPSEDFAYYTHLRPSCFFFVGAKPITEFYPHHHPKFNVNEKSMLIAAKAMGRVVLKALDLLA